MNGDALRLLRIFNEYSATDLSEKLGISKSYLSEIENGKKQPTLELIDKYAKVFNMRPSTLLLFAEAIEDDPECAAGNKQRVARASIKLLNILDKVGDLSSE